MVITKHDYSEEDCFIHFCCEHHIRSVREYLSPILVLNPVSPSSEISPSDGERDEASSITVGFRRCGSPVCVMVSCVFKRFTMNFRISLLFLTNGLEIKFRLLKLVFREYYMKPIASLHTSQVCKFK